MSLTTVQAKWLRWLLGLGGIALLFGGVASCQAATETTYVCLGSSFECAVTQTPGWATALGWLGALGGPLLLFSALLTRSPQEERREKASIEAYVQRGRDVISTVRERDGGACQECGATDGTDVVYRTTQVPSIRDQARYDPKRMILLCKTHRVGLPLARGVLNVPIGGPIAQGGRIDLDTTAI